MTRLDDLRTLRATLMESIEEVSADKRAPLAAQLRATLAEIDELDDGSAGAERTGLSEFEQRLKDRQAEAPGSRRTAR